MFSVFFLFILLVSSVSENLIFLSLPVECLWAACNWTASRLLFEMDFLKDKTFKKGEKEGEMFLLLAFVSQCSEPGLILLLLCFCCSIIVFFDLLKIHMALFFNLQSAYKDFFFLIFLNVVFNLLFLFYFHCDLPSMATCILTSMRDLYSVTLHFPCSLW